MLEIWLERIPKCNLRWSWFRFHPEGAGQPIVVSQAEVRDLKKRIQQLERCLGDKTLKVEIFKEAVRIGREKNSSRGSRHAE